MLLRIKIRNRSVCEPMLRVNIYIGEEQNMIMTCSGSIMSVEGLYKACRKNMSMCVMCQNSPEKTLHNVNINV